MTDEATLVSSILKFKCAWFSKLRFAGGSPEVYENAGGVVVSAASAVAEALFSVPDGRANLDSARALGGGLREGEIPIAEIGFAFAIVDGGNLSQSKWVFANTVDHDDVTDAVSSRNDDVTWDDGAIFGEPSHLEAVAAFSPANHVGRSKGDEVGLLRGDP